MTKNQVKKKSIHNFTLREISVHTNAIIFIIEKNNIECGEYH
jgi:hypothetical protein